jgi:hypothetical protein
MRAALAVLLTLLPALASADAPGQVTLSLDDYARLMAQAQQRLGDQATWGRAAVTVELPDGTDAFATVSLSAQVAVGGEAAAEVAVLPADVVLLSATVDGSDATLLRASGVHLLRMDSKRARVELTYRVPVTTAGAARHAVVPLPPVPGAAARIDGSAAGGGPIEVAPASDARQSGNELTANLPASAAFSLRWGGDAGGAAIRSVDYRLRLDESGDGVFVDATYEVAVTADAADVRLERAAVALVEAAAGRQAVVARVRDGAHTVRLWGAGSKTVTARFLVPIDRTQGQPQIGLTPIGIPIVGLRFDLPGERTVTVEPAAPVTRRTEGRGVAAKTVSRAWLPPTDAFAVRWTESRAAPESMVRTNVETWQLVTMEEGVLRSRVVLDYEVIRGKVKSLPIALPEDVVPFKVEGDAIEDWRTFAATDEAPRQVRVVLGEETDGRFRIELMLEQRAPQDEGAGVGVPVARPLQVFRESGVVALFDGDKVGFAEATPEGYTRVGEDALPVDLRQSLSRKVNQAFKHVGVAGPIATSVAQAKVREVRFDARVDTLYTVKEGSMVGQASVLVEVKSGRRDLVVLSLPEGLAEPRITAPSLNKVDPKPDLDVGPGRSAYEVRFTQALEGAIQIDVEFEQLLPRELGTLGLPGVRVEGAELEQGSLGITTETGMEVTPAEAEGVRRVNAEELPKAVRLRSDREIRLGYTYARAPWSLQMEVKRHETVETLKGVITAAWLETHVLENGHVVSHGTFQVANQDLQFLRLTLPEGAQVLTVTAAGQGVKAVADDQGAVAIPLPKNRSLMVDLTWEVVRGRLGVGGGVELRAPHPDIRTSDVQWKVRVPSDITLYGVDTDLKETPSWQFRMAEEDVRGQLPVTLPMQSDYQERLFTYSVLDPATETPLTIGFTYVGASASAFDGFFYFGSLILLGLVTRKRARGDVLTTRDWGLMGGGLMLIVLKMVGWGLRPEEGVLALVVLVAVAFVARRSARRTEAAAGVPS